MHADQVNPDSAKSRSRMFLCADRTATECCQQTIRRNSHQIKTWIVCLTAHPCHPFCHRFGCGCKCGMMIDQRGRFGLTGYGA
jgi:hypothetical protein